MSTAKSFAPWLPSDQRLNPFYAGITTFVDSYLEPASSLDEDEFQSLGAKTISDPILGYIHLQPWEAAFIETRLFQRLRKIKQLGFAHYVYPSLGYSRFEHTLGVLGRVNQIITRLRQVHGEDAIPNASVLAQLQHYESHVRIAALFHDIGHCIFSHVSERAIKQLAPTDGYPEFDLVSNLISNSLNTPKALAPAELLSVAIVSSPPIREFATKLNIPGANSNSKIRDYFKSVAMLIAGVPPASTPDTVFLAQMISSGLDCDKLDYMLREAYFANIPVAIDIQRIINKIRVYNLMPEELPGDLRYLKASLSGSNYNVLGVSHGGQFAFEEFCMSRTALYDKIYLHHKVRAAEAQALDILKALPAKSDHFNHIHNWLYLTDSLIDFDSTSIPTHEVDLFSKNDLRVEHLAVAHLRDKSLLKRAFAMGMRNSLSESTSQEIGLPSKTLSLISDISDNSADFIERIRAETRRIAPIVEQSIKEVDIARIIIDICDHRRVQQGASTIYIRHPITIPQKWALPIDQIVTYYLNARALTYIYAPHSICHLVLLAVERVVWEGYGLQFEQREFLSDSTVNKSDESKEKLTSSDYYNDAFQLKRRSKHLLTAVAQEYIWGVVRSLETYTSSVSGSKVSPERVMSFVTQFSDNLHLPLLELLSYIKVIQPNDILKLLATTSKSLKENGKLNVLVAPLGNMMDSAAHLAYYLKNNNDEEVRSVAENINLLNDATLVNIDALVVFDDNINTAAQAINIFTEWMGEPPPGNHALPEKHVSRLNDASIQRLREMPIVFVFGIAAEDAFSDLPRMLNQYCHIDSSRVSVKCVERLAKDNRPLTGGNSPLKLGERTLLRSELYRIGYELMLNQPSKLSQEKKITIAQARALGDGGTEGLVVMPYNVPSMSITALWCGGKLNNGQKWLPLVERRRHIKLEEYYASDSGSV